MITTADLHRVTHRGAGATFAARFFLKIAAQPAAGCWRWGAGFFENGYGQYHVDRQPVGAHVVAWLLARGEIPAGLCVLHSCDNRWCVRPSHLFLGTKGDNARDMASKGRATFQTHPEKTQGERHRHTLTAVQVLAVRASERPAADLARELGVQRGAIYKIRSGRSWKSLAVAS